MEETDHARALQKWSKGKVREKLNNMVCFDQITYDRMMKEVRLYLTSAYDFGPCFLHYRNHMSWPHNYMNSAQDSCLFARSEYCVSLRLPPLNLSHLPPSRSA